MITKNEISSLNLSPTKKDFVQIWNELIEVASKITERWDPTSTNESDPGIVLLKVLAGIADKLNYNIDKNILEAYMPTAAQMESMHKLCELVGYDIKYYQSAQTKVRISYTGNTSSDSEEALPQFGLPIPKFTTITNADKDIAFVTINEVPLLITNTTPWVEVPCIEGQLSQCESINENNLITHAQIDDNNRYYLPEIQIAENGIFVYNAVVNQDTLTDGTVWQQVSNLNTQPSDSRVFKFGYDSFEGRPYLAFPDDIGNLIGDGLFIYFIRTSGVNGNISPRTLEVLEIPDAWSQTEEYGKYSAEQFEVVNVDATTNGANIESISAAYKNFKRTVGTFDTLVTCRDYMNKIYSLMDADNSPYVSNILVTDIRNDINHAITLCSCNEFGILYKETPLTKEVTQLSKLLGEPHATIKVEESTNKLIIQKSSVDDIKSIVEVPELDHFDLVLYPFKTFTQVSQGSTKLADSYNKSFTYTEQMNNDIEASLEELKTCAHKFVTPKDGDVVAITNYLQLNALIATSTRVSDIEANDILKNVKVALVNEFNLRNLDFGEEIPFDNILSVIENADSRIKVVSLQEPKLLTTYSVKEAVGGVSTSKEYGIASSAGQVRGDHVIYDETVKTAKGETAKDIYNKLVLRNILAGRASLFNYEETFIPNNSEKPYTVTKNITGILGGILEANYIYDQSPQEDDDYKKLIDTIKVLLGATASDIELDSLLEKAAAIDSAIKKLSEATDEAILIGDDDQPLAGFYNGILTARYSEDPAEYNYEIYETYKHSFVTETPKPATFRRTRAAETPTSTPANGDIIKGIKRIEAVCEITSNEDGVFNNITLKKNEVIKFRAPNLTTTRTFPAYVYYNYTKAPTKTLSDGESTVDKEGRYARATQLKNFIGIGDRAPAFFKKLFELAGEECKTITAQVEKEDGTGTTKVTADDLNIIFNSSIAIVPKNGSTVIMDISGLNDYIRDIAEDTPSITSIEFNYYPLHAGTMSVWEDCIRHFDNNLPAGTVLWRLSQTSSYPKGKYVIDTHQRLFVQNSEYLLNSKVGDITYICTDVGADPERYTITENSDIQLGRDDKLYIHYTPSSTNEEGETVNAEPISIVYTGSDKEPLIIKPSGFVLQPSADLVTQGAATWKKTNVKFNDEEVNLLALAPNEQIELRSVSKVVLNKSARFYKNFDNELLERGDVNKEISYELKDGEYIFYTDQNTMDAAYYGSGSVITLRGGAYIPKTEKIEVSDILEQGLHIVPWGSIVLLNDDRTVTVAEYQYITLVEGDTLNTLTIEEPDANGKYIISSGREVKNNDNTLVSSPWVKCKISDNGVDLPIAYTQQGSESTVTLPKIDLATGGWEVCSFLELSTAPGYAQTLRAISPDDSLGQLTATTATVIDKIKLYLDTGTDDGSEVIEIAPQKTDIPASNGQIKFETVSVKLDTIAQVASGAFEKPTEDVIDDEDSYYDDYPEDDEEGETTTPPDKTTMQMKVFKEEPVAIIELNSIDDTITPISNKLSVPADSSLTSLNNYLTRIDIPSILFKTNGETKKHNAISINCMIPEGTDTFGIFSIYVETPDQLLDIYKAESFPAEGYRVFIDLPVELGNYAKAATKPISIFNNNDQWWSEGTDESKPNRLYLRAGLNCIKVEKSCTLLVKAEPNATGTIIYDAMRLAKGIKTNGINLKLLDFKAVNGETTNEDIATSVLAGINALDKHHNFYYNVPVENSLAIEFDNNRSSLSNPYTLYDINNINNSFVVSKLDINYLKTGLKIAKSSKY